MTAKSTAKSRILVVEDQIILLLALVDELAGQQIEAVPVTSAKGAVSLLDTVDGLITDIDLPGGYSGLQLARFAANLRPGLPIVVVSGGTRPASGDLPRGAAFLPKPYRVSDIVAALDRQSLPHAA